MWSSPFRNQQVSTGIHPKGLSAVPGQPSPAQLPFSVILCGFHVADGGEIQVLTIDVKPQSGAEASRRVFPASKLVAGRPRLPRPLTT